MKKLPLIILLSCSGLLSGCIAVVVPIAAGAALGKTQLDKQVDEEVSTIEDYYGVSKNSAVVITDDQSVILKPLADLQNPTFTNCDGKPRAMLVDIDNARQTLDQPKLMAKRHKKFAEYSGRLGLKLLYFTQRGVADQEPIEQSLSKMTGMKISADDNLFLNKDTGLTVSRDKRRWEIADKYCVVTMIADQKYDFTDSYLYLTNDDAAAVSRLDKLLGQGWFIMSDLDPL